MALRAGPLAALAMGIEINTPRTRLEFETPPGLIDCRCSGTQPLEFGVLSGSSYCRRVPTLV
jgi:hypothetical protein